MFKIAFAVNPPMTFRTKQDKILYVLSQVTVSKGNDMMNMQRSFQVNRLTSTSSTLEVISFPNFLYYFYPFQRTIQSLAFWGASAFPIDRIGAASTIHSILFTRQTPMMNLADGFHTAARNVEFAKPKQNSTFSHFKLISNIKSRAFKCYILIKKPVVLTEWLWFTPMFPLLELSINRVMFALDKLALFVSNVHTLLYHNKAVKGDEYGKV